ncbi:rod-binding protein [Bdellovibrio svalbardensis]|uniref:Rod-binding protein n=1 Tax=Bdellovibrio svalbardensis TaxID=2972972 RepID=A0ABT6DK33_9BACT|nr:rod-binding protein [Bdellovibrio svalbardensis]MDG0817011.1 rod-binding protein [Bdellovibrio svalbardensis]
MSKKKMAGVLLCVLAFSGVARAEFIGDVDSKPVLNQPASASQVAGAVGGAKTDGVVDNSNFKALPGRFMKMPKQKSPDEKLRDVSDMYEKHFLREMMKAMRSTVHEGGFIQQNQAEKIFREQLDDHYVDKWSEKGGIGLSKLIYEQLIDKFGVQLGIKRNVAKPQGPLPLDEKSNYSAHQFRHPGKKQALSYRIDKMAVAPGAPQEKPEVKAPWDGVLLGSKTLADKQTMVEIEHDNGLKSQMVFKGDVSKVSTGEKIQAGETLGVLSPESKSLYWTVEGDKEPGPQTVSE